MIWQRLLTFFSGADVFSVTIVVAAFMAGLGFGSLLGGRLADRWTPRGCLIAFAVAEFFIGVFALVSDDLFYGVLYQRFGGVSLPTIALALVLFVVLLPPTLAMGVSLPLLGRALTARASAASETIGTLYGVNTLGAAAGAIVTTWWCLRSMSFAGVLAFGAALNVLAAIAGLLAARGHIDDASEEDQRHDAAAIAPNGSATGGRLGYRSLVVVFAFAGFLALMLEIVWFRILGVLLKSNSFTFGTLLGTYLAGIGLGALLGRGPARRSKDPGHAILGLVSLMSLLGASSVLVLYGMLRFSPWLADVRQFLADYEPLNLGILLTDTTPAPQSARGFVHHIFLVTHVFFPAFLVLPATLLSGAIFPFLQRAAHERLSGVGSRIGVLQASNIAGSLIGTFAAGFVILPTLGTVGALRICSWVGIAFALLSIRGAIGARRRMAIAIASASLATVIFAPSARELYACVHGVEPERIEVREDGTGVVAMVREGDGERAKTLVLTNGRGDGWLPFGRVHSLLGVLPVLMHPSPERVAILGLGSGDTLFHASIRGETKEVVCFEIVRCQEPALRALAERGNWAELATMFADPRVKVVYADGRRSLLRDRDGFDVIEADALRPSSAYSGNLYSLEYFELLRSRLRPGGIAVTWAPTARVQRTFGRAFPHALAVGPVLLGTEEPLDLDLAKLLERTELPAVKARLAISGLAFADVVKTYGTDFEPLRIGFQDRPQTGDVNRDLAPLDEFFFPEP